MDPLTLIGIGGAFAFLMLGIIMEGANPAELIGIPAFLIVIFPTICIGVAGFMKSDVSLIVAGLTKAFTGKIEESGPAISTLVEFADKARKEGLLALEDGAKTIEEPFLRKGIELAVDGTDPEEVHAILEAEIHAKKTNDKIAAKFFADLGGFAPTLGIIGAVTGLIKVLGNLSDPTAAGEGIAVAFIATLYGILFANMIFLPIGNKLKRIAEAETHHMEIIMEGILAIQAGSNPRVIEQKLMSYLPPAERAAAAHKDAA